ncbi:MAG: Small conductance mechanosensitive channel [Sporanaerobacter sp.]|jgi:moderate conductance mechanosensitive channel|uniref:mechanosensitive ion channel family protein n=1 Tax=Sporanaerobacter sp. TaxID=2010183 RepID=UPI003A0FCF22
MQGVLQFLQDVFIKENKELNVLGKIAKIAIIFLLARLGIRIVNAIINNSLEKRKKFKFEIDEKKANTLATILKNVNKYVFYFIALVPSLELFGIKATSILATAGIGGLAIGIGAQGIVKDVLTGFFILFEDQFSIGDYVKIGEYEGIVEEMGLRVTKIRGFSGELYIIPNNKIDVVINRVRGSMRALVEVSISYEEDIDKALKVLEDISLDLKNTEKAILEGPTVLGVSKLGEYDIVLTVVAKTEPMEQWRIERTIRKKVVEAFREENIDIPYPKRIVLNENS